MMARYDCRHFLGYKPCIFKRTCDGCPHYAPFGKRILIIKLGAVGDVLRTTPLLRGLCRTFPDCHITWLTEPDAVPLLEGVPEINRLMPHGFESVLQLEQESFDQLYCFDKEPKATALAMKVEAAERFGFGMSKYGNVMPLGSSSEYIFELGINDPLKFRINAKTYPQLIYECAGLPYANPEEYVFPDLSAEVAAGAEFLHTVGVDPEALIVGLNTGASDLFATKKWTEAGYAELADLLAGQLGATVLLLGGPAEAERNIRISAAANHPPINTGNGNSLREFSGIVGNLDLMITGDTLAMHIAIGLRIPVLVITGSTCPQEIELYGRGEKIISDFDCSPCYLSVCPKASTCMEAITSRQVFEAAARLLRRTSTRTDCR